MKTIIGILMLLGEMAAAQPHFMLYIKDGSTKAAISGATIIIKGPGVGGKDGLISDSSGMLILPYLIKGKYSLTISCSGYERKELFLDWPVAGERPIEILLEPAPALLEDAIVSSTRTDGRIKDLPIRVEVLGTEDMEEESSMHPSNVAMLLSEASGIQTQQTSASSGNVQIRILGLDGKYTQLLKDGFPMYSGFSNGLSIMQIPPLDLRQVELIKGSSSSLYGGDAIAGIINFISKKPSSWREWNILANQTSRSGTDMGSFYAARNKYTGLTLLTTFNHQEPVDIHNSGFTVLPRLTSFTINPKLFWYPSDSSTLSLALNANYDNRKGGDLYAVKKGPDSEHPYIETSKSDRSYYQLDYRLHLHGENILNIRNSVSLFNRDIGIMDYSCSGKQISSFSELSWLAIRKKHRFVSGFNLTTEQFTENRKTDSLLRNYLYVTPGVFLQDDWTVSDVLTAEAGLRYDHNNLYKGFLLPRVSLLFKISEHWNFRTGGGLGYKSPSIFDARTEETAYRNILPIGETVKAERSAGLNADLGYNGLIGEDAVLSVNGSFFFTRIGNPLRLDSSRSGNVTFFSFHNAGRPYTTRGTELTIRLKQDDWSLFAGYTYIDARTGDPSYPHTGLTPSHKVVFNLSKEKDNDYRIALEAFYTGRQYLSDGTGTPDYWVTGLLFEKTFKRLTLVLNFEDIGDTRQTRSGPVVIPPVNNPTFKEIYKPLEGFMANLAIKFRIW